MKPPFAGEGAPVDVTQHVQDIDVASFSEVFKNFLRFSVDTGVSTDETYDWAI